MQLTSGNEAGTAREVLVLGVGPTDDPTPASAGVEEALAIPLPPEWLPVGPMPLAEHVLARTSLPPVGRGYQEPLRHGSAGGPRWSRAGSLRLRLLEPVFGLG